ncbi:hypothetical protein D3C72_275810 [compost metagenome]
MLDDAAIDLEAWLANEVQGEFSRQENIAFTPAPASPSGRDCAPSDKPGHHHDQDHHHEDRQGRQAGRRPAGWSGAVSNDRAERAARAGVLVPEPKKAEATE